MLNNITRELMIEDKMEMFRGSVENFEFVLKYIEY